MRIANEIIKIAPSRVRRELQRRRSDVFGGGVADAEQVGKIMILDHFMSDI